MPQLTPNPPQLQRQINRREGREPLRRARNLPPPASIGRKTIHLLLLFITIVLVVDALVGEKGLMETVRARRQSRALAESVAEVKRENAALRDEARRLREDPAAIEALARQQLGLIRSGEVLFIVKNAKPVRR